MAVLAANRACAPLPHPVQMMAVAGGKERTRREWEQLLAAAGFSLRRVHRLRTLTALLEATPA